MTTKTINISQFNKIQWNALNKFTPGKKDGRNILKGVHFANDFAMTTDSHRAVFVQGDFSENNGLTLDKEYNEIKTTNEYPVNSMNRFLENYFVDTNNQFKVDVNELLEIHKSMLKEAKERDKHNSTVRMDIIIDERVMFYISRYRNTAFESQSAYFRTWKHDDITKAYNCKFMIDALSIFKAFKYKEIIIKYHEAMQPITLETEDGKVKVMLMPVRLS